MDAEKILIIGKVRDYIKELKKHRIAVDRAILFGSFAKGNYREDSDIDIAIVSKDFKGVRFYDREKLVPLRRNIDIRIEPIPFRPEDFNESDPLAAEVIATGEEIKI
ncbi:MAG TPA: nucleotidyltransferase domain-containing protein [Nitrospirota bacterium]|nr:nucleotidyltransferase domain-containing protein [Nitrospirota bacterium]